jgi:hypothetical protein
MELTRDCRVVLEQERPWQTIWRDARPTVEKSGKRDWQIWIVDARNIAPGVGGQRWPGVSEFLCARR